MSYLGALAARLRAGEAPAPLVRPADAVAVAAEVEHPEEPAADLPAAGRAPPRLSEPGPPAAPRLGHLPAATVASPHPPAAAPLPPPPPTPPAPSAAVPPSERVERQVVEHVREVRHERQTRTEVVVGQLVEPARAPAAARRPQVVQPLIREEVRYAPASPDAAPTVKAAAPDRVLPLPVVPEPPPAQAATPTVQVRIGRVVVRADPPAPPPPPAPAPPAPRVGLADYLAGREPASP